MIDSSQFSDLQPRYEAFEQLHTQGATCDAFRVKVFGKLHFLKRLKPEYSGDIRRQEALQKEFETGYRLEHPNLVRYLSLTDGAILMEYVDGETLSQRLADHPEYFSKRNTENLLRQLLEVVGYLHNHQVVHLDLKPDNILLTRIGNDVKLVDLGCCYTDTYADTQGRTSKYAAPEQLDGRKPDERTDIYAIGKILEQLPCHQHFSKVIARCTAPDPANRYQTAEQLLQAVMPHRRRRSITLIAMGISIVILGAAIFLLSGQPAQQNAQQSSVNAQDTSVQAPVQPVRQETDATVKSLSPVTDVPLSAKKTPKDPQALMKKDFKRMMDEAYRATIANFCDSLFPSPSPTTGERWAEQSTEFHRRTTAIADQLVKKYPQLLESDIRQEAETRFQHLVAYVFNKMRENGNKQ